MLKRMFADFFKIPAKYKGKDHFNYFMYIFPEVSSPKRTASNCQHCQRSSFRGILFQEIPKINNHQKISIIEHGKIKISFYSILLIIPL